MTFTATITRSRQLTLPAPLFRKKMFRPGEKVLVTVGENSIEITSALSLVKKLAGSVLIPSRFKNKSLDEIKQESKEEYFSKKRTSKL